MKKTDQNQQSYASQSTNFNTVGNEGESYMKRQVNGNIPREYLESYLKAKEYFKKTHQDTEIPLPPLNLSISETNILNGEFQTSFPRFETMYQSQIMKYNEGKRRAQSMVQNIFELEKQRAEMETKFAKRAERLSGYNIIKTLRHVAYCFSKFQPLTSG